MIQPAFTKFSVEIDWYGRFFVWPVEPVRDGEYALRNPSPDSQLRKPLWELARAWQPQVTWDIDELEQVEECEYPYLGSLQYQVVAISSNSSGMSTVLGALARIRQQLLISAPRRLCRSKISSAIREISGTRFHTPATCYVVHADRKATRSVLDLFFRELWCAVLEDSRALAKSLAQTRDVLVKQLMAPLTETGSAAAIANRMNPLGAPPRLV